MTAATAWTAGRFDARVGPKRILFGRMYEDADIERAAFAPGGRVFCIASAGCTALRLCDRHDVVACDLNPAQLAYAERRFAGAPIEVGTAEKVMGFGRALMPIVGWRDAVVRAFLGLVDPVEQSAYWADRMDTWRFRAGFDTLMSVAGLRRVYARQFVEFLPPRFGAVVRERMRRSFARHANASNPYAHALLLGEAEERAVSRRDSARIELVLTDAASYLEACPARSFDGFTLSNILDGAEPSYRKRLLVAVGRAASPDAVVILRSFAEPTTPTATDHSGRDRSMLWGIVDVRRVVEVRIDEEQLQGRAG